MANEYRVSSFTTEVLNDGAANARVSSYTIEALNDGAAQARISSMTLEVLRSLTGTTGFAHTFICIVG